MAIQKIFVFSLMTMLLTLFVMYMNIKHPAVHINMDNILLISDEVLMGAALFIIYLLLGSFYPKKASSRLIK